MCNKNATSLIRYHYYHSASWIRKSLSNVPKKFSWNYTYPSNFPEVGAVFHTVKETWI